MYNSLAASQISIINFVSPHAQRRLPSPLPLPGQVQSLLHVESRLRQLQARQLQQLGREGVDEPLGVEPDVLDSGFGVAGKGATCGGEGALALKFDFSFESANEHDQRMVLVLEQKIVALFFYQLKHMLTSVTHRLVKHPQVQKGQNALPDSPRQLRRVRKHCQWHPHQLEDLQSPEGELLQEKLFVPVLDPSFVPPARFVFRIQTPRPLKTSHFPSVDVFEHPKLDCVDEEGPSETVLDDREVKEEEVGGDCEEHDEEGEGVKVLIETEGLYTLNYPLLLHGDLFLNSLSSLLKVNALLNI